MSPRREGVRKGPAAETERDASQHAMGGIARVFFFLSYLYINSFFFNFCVSTSRLKTTRLTFFLVWKRPGGRLLPYFCSEKRVGGAILELLYRTPRGAFTPFFTVSTRFSLSIEMSRLTRDRTAEPVSREQILRRERRQGNINFPCSTDHKQDWQPYPVDPYPCYM